IGLFPFNRVVRSKLGGCIRQHRFVEISGYDTNASWKLAAKSPSHDAGAASDLEYRSLVRHRHSLRDVVRVRRKQTRSQIKVIVLWNRAYKSCVLVAHSISSVDWTRLITHRRAAHTFRGVDLDRIASESARL